MRLDFDETIVRTFLRLSEHIRCSLLFQYEVWTEASFRIRFSNKYLNGSIFIGSYMLMAVAIYIPGLQTVFNTVALPHLGDWRCGDWSLEHWIDRDRKVVL